LDDLSSEIDNFNDIIKNLFEIILSLMDGLTLPDLSKVIF